MNSQELENSLKTEFENYLRNTLAEMKQEVAVLKDSVEAEFDRQKSKLDEVFEKTLARLESDKSLDPGFKESVVEHLRLAKDEGARITATAIAEAEALETSKPSDEGVAQIHDAIYEISNKSSQSEILKSLVHHANSFAHRGAFFIVKNEHLVGWRMFGNGLDKGDELVREVFMPLSADSVLCESVRSLTSLETSFVKPADLDTLVKLGFETPGKMVAVPLVARGRGVAVLYADDAANGQVYNLPALESMVKVAGMTVEILASNKNLHKKDGAKPLRSGGFVQDGSYDDGGYDEPAKPVATPDFDDTPVQTFSSPAVEPVTAFDPAPFDKGFATANFEESVVAPVVAESPVVESFTMQETTETVVEPQSYPAFEESSWEEPVEADTPGLSPREFAENFARHTDPTTVSNDFDFGSSTSEVVQEFQFEDNAFEEKAPENPASDAFDLGALDNYVAEEPKEQKATFDFDDFKSEISAPAAPAPGRTSSGGSRSRLDRNLDLPIEVAEDERRLHNDARRFARLLVSEIKLYNEQKVKEGRDASDLYDRLREAIDRSREMYDKRVQPPVAEKFDYFHYELVNTLAEGDETKLGSDYPGAAV